MAPAQLLKEDCTWLDSELRLINSEPKALLLYILADSNDFLTVSEIRENIISRFSGLETAVAADSGHISGHIRRAFHCALETSEKEQLYKAVDGKMKTRSVGAYRLKDSLRDLKAHAAHILAVAGQHQLPLNKIFYTPTNDFHISPDILTAAILSYIGENGITSAKDIEEFVGGKTERVLKRLESLAKLNVLESKEHLSVKRDMNIYRLKSQPQDCLNLTNAGNGIVDYLTKVGQYTSTEDIVLECDGRGRYTKKYIINQLTLLTRKSIIECIKACEAETYRLGAEGWVYSELLRPLILDHAGERNLKESAAKDTESAIGKYGWKTKPTQSSQSGPLLI